MKSQNQAIILTASTPDLPTLPNMTEWGLLGAACYLALTQGLNWFRDKEKGETALINSLISNQQRILERLLEVQQVQHEDFKELKMAILGFGNKLEKSIDLQNRALAQVQREITSLKTRKESQPLQ